MADDAADTLAMLLLNEDGATLWLNVEEEALQQGLGIGAADVEARSTRGCSLARRSSEWRGCRGSAWRDGEVDVVVVGVPGEVSLEEAGHRGGRGSPRRVPVVALRWGGGEPRQ